MPSSNAQIGIDLEFISHSALRRVRRARGRRHRACVASLRPPGASDFLYAVRSGFVEQGPWDGARRESSASLEKSSY
jgi:hypothetical protein